MPWLTPDEIPEATLCRSLLIPDNPAIIECVTGALLDLTKKYNWQLFGTVTPEQMSESMMTMFLAYFESACGTGDVPTPYWDETTDLDDELPPDEQPWYGEIVGGNFQETLENWVIAGFVAYAATPAAALVFLTLAPKFRLAWKTGDLGGIIRVFVDAEDQGTVDTYAASDGVLEKEYIGDPDLTEHTIMMVLESV